VPESNGGFHVYKDPSVVVVVVVVDVVVVDKVVDDVVECGVGGCVDSAAKERN
jgi:hypothetical protein